MPDSATALNIVARLSGALGIAVLTVLLQRDLVGIAGEMGRGGLDASQLVALAGDNGAAAVAGAFSQLFVGLAVLTVVMLLPVVLLPRRGTAEHEKAPAATAPDA